MRETGKSRGRASSAMGYTERARGLFLDTGTRFPRDIIWAMGALKAAAARANRALGLLEGPVAGAIEAASREVMEGAHDQEIVVDVFQTGSGTGLNMNVNEVIARRASEILGSGVHPNDHVNMSQSSNDVVPSAMRAAAVRASARALPALRGLASALRELSSRTSGIVKAGRTHLRDALPVTMGQEFGAYASAISRDADALEAAVERARELPMGGTAVGTGLNAPEGFAEAAVAELNSLTGERFRPAGDRFAAMRLLTDLLGVSAALRSAALDIMRLSQDLRLMFSGPSTGLGEIDIPSQAEVAGSSIMPGKTNPVTVEACMQAAAQVMGLDHAIQVAGMLGEFELSMGIPVAGYDLALEMILVSEAASKMARVVIPSVVPDERRARRYAESSQALVTVISPIVGYDRAAEVGRRVARGESLADALRALGLDELAVGELLDLRRLVGPGIPARRRSGGRRSGLRDHHAERGPDVLQLAYAAAHYLLDLLHAIGLHLRHQVVDAVDHVGLSHVRYSPELPQDLLLRPCVGVYQDERLRHLARHYAPLLKSFPALGGLRYLKPTPYPSEKIGRSPFSHRGIPSSLHPSGGLPRSPFSNTKLCMNMNAESQLCMRSNARPDASLLFIAGNRSSNASVLSLMYWTMRPIRFLRGRS